MIHAPAPLITGASRARPAPRAGRVIAVASGKGGVGKTWLAITTAHALARQGRRALLVDADLGLANVDIQLGLLPARDLSAVIAGTAALPDAIAPHADGGFDILPGRSGSGGLAALAPATLDALLADLRALAASYDAVLLDLGAGVERAARRLAAWADTLLVVATAEPTSLTDAYAVLKLHAADTAADGASADARVVVNQAVGRAEGERTHATLARAAVTFLGRAPALAGVVRRDEAVPAAIRRQSLLLTRAPACRAAEDIGALAAGLL